MSLGFKFCSVYWYIIKKLVMHVTGLVPVTKSLSSVSNDNTRHWIRKVYAVTILKLFTGSS